MRPRTNRCLPRATGFHRTVSLRATHFAPWSTVVAVVISKRKPITVGGDDQGKADAAPTQREKVNA